MRKAAAPTCRPSLGPHTQQNYPFDTWRASHPDPASETLCSGPGPGLEALRHSESRRSRVSVMTLPLFHAPDR
jgi:hypothetical protein